MASPGLGPVLAFAMDGILGLQKWLYTGAMDALDAARLAGASELPALIATAFGFGLLHALLPGHGKSQLASHYAGAGGVPGAVAASVILIVTHVGLAVVLVLTGHVVATRGLVGAGGTPALERASQGLIVLIGLWLLWRALRPHRHDPERSGAVLGLASGLVPCPLTTFIMTYSAMKGAVAIGLVLSAAFAAGMVATVAAFPVLAVVLRGRLLSALASAGRWGTAAAKLLAVAAALAVVLLGLWPLLPR